MMASKKRAIITVAVALTVVAATASVRAQDQTAAGEPAPATSISKPAAAPPSPVAPASAAKDAAAVIDNKPFVPPMLSPARASAVTSAASAAIAGHHDQADVKALHDPALRQKVKDVLTKLTPERARLDHDYQQAALLFPSFCKDWERKLRDRESNNVAHLIWKLENGFETALYTGYGPVETCETHQSDQGFSIGKLTYEEFHYRMKGKTLDEAKATKATPVDDTHTTEIFRWDKGKWFY